jgi:hypothetical protein
MCREGCRQHQWVFAVDRNLADPEGKSCRRVVPAAASGLVRTLVRMEYTQRKIVWPEGIELKTSALISW